MESKSFQVEIKLLYIFYILLFGEYNVDLDFHMFLSAEGNIGLALASPVFRIPQKMLEESLCYVPYSESKES